MLKTIEWCILTKDGGVRPGITGEITLTVDTKNVNISMETFDGFDVHVNGRMLYFSNDKTREMFAIMVEEHGSSISLSQMTYLLYESIEERTTKNSLRVIYYHLRMNLVEYEIEQILIRKRGSYVTDTELFICDFYKFIKGNSDYITPFSGNYTPEYAQAEDMLPYPRNLYRECNRGLI